MQKLKKNIKPNKTYLNDFLNKYWYVLPDVLLRSSEASIWHHFKFKSPVLDIGIGNGEISTILFKKHKKIDVGIDIEGHGLREALKTGKYRTVIKMSAENIKLKEGFFSTVISNSTFEHIKNDKKAVSEAARVLRRNGLFIFSVPTAYLTEWIKEYEDNKNPQETINKLRKFNNRAYHLHYRDIEEWSRILGKNGLTVIFYKYYFPKTVSLFWYRLFTFVTKKIHERELWSLIGFSKITRVLPKSVIIYFLRLYVNKLFKLSLLTTEDKGGMLFVVAKKT